MAEISKVWQSLKWSFLTMQTGSTTFVSIALWAILVQRNLKHQNYNFCTEKGCQSISAFAEIENIFKIIKKMI